MSSAIGVGTMIAEKYIVERLLGKGGMGVVVAATDVELLERRAIKMLRPDLASDAGIVRRFMREARATTRLTTEHVPRVYEVGCLEGGSPYMVMEYIEGIDLAALHRQKGVFPIDQTALLGIQACDALAEAHEIGLIHRDIKLSNLFLTRRPDRTLCLKVLDFGISKVLSPGNITEDLTATGTLLGTPIYMPPEQLRRAADADARADVWAMGVVLYVLLTGQFPFDASDPGKFLDLMLDVRITPRPPWELRQDLPYELGVLLLRCLEKDLAKRIGSVADLAAGLYLFSSPGVEREMQRMERGSEATLKMPIAPPDRL